MLVYVFSHVYLCMCFERHSENRLRLKSLISLRYGAICLQLTLNKTFKLLHLKRDIRYTQLA